MARSHNFLLRPSVAWFVCAGVSFQCTHSCAIVRILIALTTEHTSFHCSYVADRRKFSKMKEISGSYCSTAFIHTSFTETTSNIHENDHYQRLSCNSIIAKGFTGLQGVRIIRPPRRKKNSPQLGPQRCPLFLTVTIIPTMFTYLKLCILFLAVVHVLICTNSKQCTTCDVPNYLFIFFNEKVIPRKNK